MVLWRIAPAANPRDSWWQGRRIFEEVIVRAPSAAMARRIASRLEANPDEPPVGNESPYFRSGFEDEKLYWVARLGSAEAAHLGAGGPDGIVHVARHAGPRSLGSTQPRRADTAPEAPPVPTLPEAAE